VTAIAPWRDVAELADALQAVLSDSGYRSRAARIAEAMDALPAVDDSVEVIEAV